MNPLPQNRSVDAVLGGQEYWRLKTPLQWPGAPNTHLGAEGIFESEVGALAVAIGPDSDIANVQVTYFDGTVSSPNVRSAIVSPDRSFVGRIDARMDVAYPECRRKGRILFHSRDIVPLSTWRPIDFAAGDDSIQFQRPVLDVIQYFSAPPSLIPQRSDRLFEFQYLFPPPGGPGKSAYLMIPAYGRKSGYFTFYNQDGIATVTTSVRGVRFSPSQLSAIPGVDGTVTSTLFTSALLSGQSANYTYKSSTAGLWDMFLVKLQNYQGASFPLHIQLSDDIL